MTTSCSAEMASRKRSGWLSMPTKPTRSRRTLGAIDTVTPLMLCMMALRPTYATARIMISPVERCKKTEGDLCRSDFEAPTGDVHRAATFLPVAGDGGRFRTAAGGQFGGT